ncbi:MAG: GTPase [Christensenellaceae bacterium]
MRSGYVAVIGRANAGKSTLINVMVGEKVSIVSPKPQTTRDRILGVLTEKDYQIVFVDTPGIYRAKNALTDMMMHDGGKREGGGFYSVRAGRA